MSLADIAAAVGRRDSKADVTDLVDIITFIQAPWGLNLQLFPVQRVILKAHYGLELDDNPHGFPLDAPIPKDHPAYKPDLVDIDGFYVHRVPITDFRRENPRVMTEAGYLAYLHAEGRCNISKVIPGRQRREMVLSIGRRSGKTLITSCILAYETYKLLQKYNPKTYYGSSQSNQIQLISVATGKEQAALLFGEAKGHFSDCDFFAPYTANNTQSFYTFQSPYDIDRYGAYKDNAKAPFSLKVSFKSCVAKGLRGGANIFVALDEVAHFGLDGQASADEIYQAVEPSTRTFSPKDPRDKTKPIGENDGRIVLISSPLGKQGLFYKQFRLGFGNNKAADNLLCIQAPTWEVNPTIPPETFIASYLKDTAAFETEFGAEFTARTRGWITRPQDLFDCIRPNLRPKSRALPRVPHFMGLDIALVGDYTAAAIGHLEDDGTVTLDLIERIKAGEGEFADYERLEFDAIADWVEDLTRRFYIKEGIFDQWSGDVLEQAMHKRGLRQMKKVLFNRNLASQVYQNFKDMMMDRRLALFDFPIPDKEEHCDYIRELLELQAETQSKYIIKVEAPQLEGKHDDYADALVRMVWVATQAVASSKTIRGGPNGESLQRSVSFGSAGHGSTFASGFGTHSSRQPFQGLVSPRRIRMKRGR